MSPEVQRLNHTIAQRNSLTRGSSIVDDTVIVARLSSMDTAENTAGMLSLQVLAMDTASKQCCCSQSKIKLHGINKPFMERPWRSDKYT